MSDWKACKCHLCKGQEWPFHCGCGAIRRYDDTLTWCSDSARHFQWELKRDGRDGKDTQKLFEAQPPAGEGAQETPVDHRCPEIGSDILQGAFVLGAKWWEWQSTKGNYILDSLV